MVASLTIIMWLWNGPGGAWGRYGPDHVNRAARMVRQNLTLDHELVCITDTPEASFISDVSPIPIWPDLADRGRCFRRLKLFEPETARSIGERLAWIDLDCVVLGNLDPVFSRTEDLVLWRSQSTRAPYNGSIVLMTAGCRPHVWADYTPSIALRNPGSDQAWLAHVLGPREAVWTQDDGVIAFNRYGRRARFAPGPDWRIMFFPGTVKSNSHICRKTTPWVQPILNQYGDFDEPGYQWRPRKAVMRLRRMSMTRGKRAGVHIKSWGG